MTDSRTSQIGFQTWVNNPPSVHFSQIGLEVWTSIVPAPTYALFSQIGLEVWYKPVPSVVTVAQFSQIGLEVWSKAAPLNPATDLLLVPHYLASGYAEAGTVVTEGQNIPLGWIPTAACDPQGSAAIQAFWNVGPRPISGGEYSRDFYPWVPLKPVVYWQFYDDEGGYILTGAGAALGPRRA